MVTGTRQVVLERDEHGSPYAVEVVEAAGWDEALLEPPDPREADARVVRLREGRAPLGLPRWLWVEAVGWSRNGGRRRAAESPAEYRAGGEEAGSEGGPGSVGGALWPWSPSYRGPGPGLDEFLAAGALAARHPQPAPVERGRRLEELRALAEDGGEGELAPLAGLRGIALERWLRVAFGDPDGFADAVLRARIASSSREDAAAVLEELRFLREAQIPQSESRYAELAVDRRALLEHASPWRYVEGAPFDGALRAVRAWRARYRRAYDRHYREVATAAARLRGELEAAAPAAEALRRLNTIGALGRPPGRVALLALERAGTELRTIATEPDGLHATTSRVVLGRDPPCFAEAREAVRRVGEALEQQRARLAAGAVRAVLARPGVPALDRFLQAMAASDVDAIERVLTPELAAHVESLLEGAEGRPSPLEAVAIATPEVTAASRDAVVAAFAEALDRALAEAPDGVVRLREGGG